VYGCSLGHLHAARIGCGRLPIGAAEFGHLPVSDAGCTTTAMAVIFGLADHWSSID